jgi:hypothetical protein
MAPDVGAVLVRVEPHRPSSFSLESWIAIFTAFNDKGEAEFSTEEAESGSKEKRSQK